MGTGRLQVEMKAVNLPAFSWYWFCKVL